MSRFADGVYSPEAGHAEVTHHRPGAPGSRQSQSSSLRYLFVSLIILTLVVGACSSNEHPGSPTPAAQVTREKPRRDRTEYSTTSGQPTATRLELQERGMRTDDLSWLPAAPAISRMLPGRPLVRSSVLAAKLEAATADDPPTARARANSVLASEALTRASIVVRHWLDKRDPTTGLIANLRSETGTTGWFYQDTGSDLFPFVAIGAYFLFPDRYDETLSVLAAERQLGSTAAQVPADVLLPDGRQADGSDRERMFGAAEYAKDGLLPLVERLGPDPWLGRLQEISDAIVAASATSTPRGSIPAPSNEVNGDVLQVLTRAYWATGDDRYFWAADRIATAYVEDMMPKTEGLPVHEWDFMQGEPVGSRRLRLSDHGNEIIAGLVNWHLAESVRGERSAATHRTMIRKMLDRMLANGRNPDGLWYRVMLVPSGDVDQEGLSDNFGYVFQAFLLQAFIERTLPGGDADRAEEYEQATRTALRALPKYAYYPWQRGAMDGFADGVEGALSLQARLPDPEAERWVDEQTAVLFGFQGADGIVEDNYLDGNFVRTALLYNFSLTGGTWLDPWRADLIDGAAMDGSCLQLVLGSGDAWAGRLRFDSPRHQESMHLPVDFPRLNEWPESFTATAGREYVVDGPPLLAGVHTGESLEAGLPLQLLPGQTYDLRVCPR